MESTIFVNLVTMAQVSSKQVDFVQMIANSSAIIIIDLIVLTIFSIVSWYIIGYKAFYLYKAKRESQVFLETFWASKRLAAIYQLSDDMKRSPLAQVFRAAYLELSKIKSGERQATMGGQLGSTENIERAMRRAVNSEVTTLESLLTFLATTGATAPFLGLFGTVLGIMNSLVNIDKDVTLDLVAPGIAEALLTTAIGLVAAIPAVMAYNLFSARIRVLASEMDSFSADFLNIIKRHFLK